MIQQFYTFNFEKMVDLINGLYGTCTAPLTGTPTGEGCLAKFTVDRRTTCSGRVVSAITC